MSGDIVILAVLGAVHTFIRNHGTRVFCLSALFHSIPMRHGPGAGSFRWRTLPIGLKGRSVISSRSAPEPDRSDEFQRLWALARRMNNGRKRQGGRVLSTRF